MTDRPVAMSLQRSTVPSRSAAASFTSLRCVRSASHAAPPLAVFAAASRAAGSGARGARAPPRRRARRPATVRGRSVSGPRESRREGVERRGRRDAGCPQPSIIADAPAARVPAPSGGRTVHAPAQRRKGPQPVRCARPGGGCGGDAACSPRRSNPIASGGRKTLFVLRESPIRPRAFPLRARWRSIAAANPVSEDKRAPRLAHYRQSARADREATGGVCLKPTDIAHPDYFHKVVDCPWACPAHTPFPNTFA